MRYALHYLLMLLVSSALLSSPAAAAPGGITYHARVVHNNRAYISAVRGTIGPGAAAYNERVEDSYVLDWRKVPGDFVETSPALPEIWGRGDETCQQFAGGLPAFNSPLLRHFIVGQVIGGHMEIAKGNQYLGGQLEIIDAQTDDAGFEFIAKFMGNPLVIVGRHHRDGDAFLVDDLAVLGVHEELYQYFIDGIETAPGPEVQQVAFPEFDPGRYVNFTAASGEPVPVRPVKDWLVFQAHLPNGRPLNLVFDSGAETMIVDNMVLELDAGLKPSGEMVVAGAFETGKMKLYEGFSFIAGGVEFKNLPVAGMGLTSLAYGADLRIHGVVGNEILQLCRLDIDLEQGQLSLLPPDSAGEIAGERLPITFIHDMPHIIAGLHGEGDSLVLLDTGQRTGLQVNIDYLEKYELGDDLVMNGFLGDITGGLQPRFMLEQLDVTLGGSTFDASQIDALMASSYEYEGQPVVGSVGFSLLAGHYSGVTFDYANKALYVRDAAESREFVGQPEAWDVDWAGGQQLLADAGSIAEDPAAELPQPYGEAGGSPGLPSGGQRSRQGNRSIDGLRAGSIGDVRSFAPGLSGMGIGYGGNPGEQLYRQKLIAATGESSQLVQLKNGYGEPAAAPAPAPAPAAEPPALTADPEIMAHADKLTWHVLARAKILLRQALEQGAAGTEDGLDELDEFWQTRNRSRFEFPPLKQ